MTKAKALFINMFRKFSSESLTLEFITEKYKYTHFKTREYNKPKPYALERLK